MDRISEKRRSYNMSRIRSTNTGPEMTVRRLVYSLGYRYRLHDRSLPGKPDLVFKGAKKAIFVHGCFWHQHPSTECSDSRRPKSNIKYWSTKLDSNRDRDLRNQASLVDLGWTTLVIWECEIERSMSKVKDSVVRFLSPENQAVITSGPSGPR